MGIDRFIIPLATGLLPTLISVLFIFYREHGGKPLQPDIIWILGISSVLAGAITATVLLTTGTPCCS